MPRTSGADNSVFFRKEHERGASADAERILRQIEISHDNWNLLEMNGAQCAGRQISRLRWYDRTARKNRES